MIFAGWQIKLNYGHSYRYPGSLKLTVSILRRHAGAGEDEVRSKEPFQTESEYKTCGIENTNITKLKDNKGLDTVYSGPFVITVLKHILFLSNLYMEVLHYDDR